MRDSFAPVPSSPPRPLAGKPAQAPANSLPTAPTPATPTDSLGPAPPGPDHSTPPVPASERVGKCSSRREEALDSFVPRREKHDREGSLSLTSAATGWGRIFKRTLSARFLSQLEPIKPSSATKNRNILCAPSPATVTAVSTIHPSAPLTKSRAPTVAWFILVRFLSGLTVLLQRPSLQGKPRKTKPTTLVGADGPPPLRAPCRRILVPFR